MARELLLFRHGKSDWEVSKGGDHERPLAPRGRKAARQMGKWLARAGAVPDLVAASTAVRARATVELAAEAAGWGCPMRWEEHFYTASPEELLEWVRGLDEGVERPLLVGHEPSWSAFAGLLIGGGRVRLPTAAVACIRVDGAWADLTPGGGELEWLTTPRLLG